MPWRLAAYDGGLERRGPIIRRLELCTGGRRCSLLDAMADDIVAYEEGDDLVRTNERRAPYDRWFLVEGPAERVLSAYVDFDQPVPPKEQVFD